MDFNTWAGDFTQRLGFSPTARDVWVEMETMSKDAERYRWLRARVSGHRALGSARPATFAFPGVMALPPLGDIMRGSVAEHLDCAIDEQMRQECVAVGAA